VPKNLDSSGPALRRSSGTAVFVYEPAEHGFSMNSGTDRFAAAGGFRCRRGWPLIEAAMWAVLIVVSRVLAKD
jgi:membrane-associated phospholipid phosphatase